MTGKKRSRSTRPATAREGPAMAVRRTKGPKPGLLHLYVGISLDGYLAAADGGVDWLNPYADARAGYTPFIKTIGSAVMGRATYDQAVSHGHGAFGKMPAYIVTHRPFPPPSPYIIPYSGDLAELVRQIRERHPGDIWLMGGGNLTKAFQEADLIDVWTVAFVPTLLGRGIPMFPPAAFPERLVRLVKTLTYPSGVVELRYERRPA
jgi:dihydrofolate reductase